MRLHNIQTGTREGEGEAAEIEARLSVEDEGPCTELRNSVVIGQSLVRPRASLHLLAAGSPKGVGMY